MSINNTLLKLLFQSLICSLPLALGSTDSLEEPLKKSVQDPSDHPVGALSQEAEPDAEEASMRKYASDYLRISTASSHLTGNVESASTQCTSDWEKKNSTVACEECAKRGTAANRTLLDLRSETEGLSPPMQLSRFHQQFIEVLAIRSDRILTIVVQCRAALGAASMETKWRQIADGEERNLALFYKKGELLTRMAPTRNRLLSKDK